jgi:Domain of unknown function (DUF4252)
MRVLWQKLCGKILLGVIFACAVRPCLAQNGKLQLQNLEKLSAKAAEVNDVTLDGSLLQLAAKFLDAEGDSESREIKEMVRNLKGIYVKNFEFDEPNQYSQADVEAIRTQLAAPGWQRIVTSHNKRNHENDEVYLLKEGEKVTGVAILVAEARELTVVNIVGPIDFDKLGELGGHFGIPDEINDHPKSKKGDSPKAKAEKPEKKEADGEKK